MAHRRHGLSQNIYHPIQMALRRQPARQKDPPLGYSSRSVFGEFSTLIRFRGKHKIGEIVHSMKDSASNEASFPFEPH